MERETGIEPATNSLEGCDSTTELLPPTTRAVQNPDNSKKLELMMGLEPMTSPLPRECSTTELHQPSYTSRRSRLRMDASYPILREPHHPSTTRSPKNPSSSQVNCSYFPGSIVSQTAAANNTRTASERTI